jgi:hypothetical protein
MARRIVAGRIFSFLDENAADGFDECIEQKEGIQTCLLRFRGQDITPAPAHENDDQQMFAAESDVDEPDECEDNPSP